MQIQTFQNAPRDAEKLRRLLEVKQRQKEGAMHIKEGNRPMRTKKEEEEDDDRL